MDKYYHVTAHTPFCGEERDYYVFTDSEEELYQFLNEAVYDNAAEWWDSDCGMDIEEYYEESYTTFEEITFEEFKEHEREGL